MNGYFVSLNKIGFITIALSRNDFYYSAKLTEKRALLVLLCTPVEVIDLKTLFLNGSMVIIVFTFCI